MKSTQAIDRLRQVIRRQHKALATEDCYAFWLRRYIHALHSTPTDLPSEKKLELFLTGLALRYNLAASTQNQAFNAVVFFYKEVLGNPLGNVDALRAKRPAHERHAPSVSQGDIANLKAEEVDWDNSTVSFLRKKTGVPVLVHLGTEALNLFGDLPAEGPLFPSLSNVRAGDRATEFAQRCRQLGIKGVTLHSTAMPGPNAQRPWVTRNGLRRRL